MDAKIIVLITVMGLIIPNNSFEDTDDISFEKVLDNRSVYIDKTLFVKTLFDKETPAKILIRAPQGYGKSTNLDMIKRFVEIDVQHYNTNQSNPVDVKKTQNYNLFTAGIKLNIFNHQKLFNEHFGKYPVIFIDYKPLYVDTMSINYDNILARIERVLNNIFVQHEYLLKSSKLWSRDETDGAVTQEQFNKFISHSQQKIKLSEMDIKNGFVFLAQLLFKEFGKKVFVMIDDFDTYIDNLNLTGNKDTDRIVAFIQSITGELLKSNYVDRALLMGTHCEVNNRSSPHNKNNSTLSNINEYKFLESHAFSEYHGITENEFNKLLHRTIDDANEIVLTKDLVNKNVPYHTLVKQNIKLYTTFPVVNFMRHRARTGYRLASSDF